MTLTFQVEQFDDCWRECDKQLVQAHYEEIALDKETIPLDWDYDNYKQLADDGQLHFVTVRLDGSIIGYHVTIVRPHLHYKSTLCGFTDLYFLLPEYRRGRIGLQMFEFVEKTLKARGVVKLFTGTKTHFDLSNLFERMGWHFTERLFTKVINPASAEHHTLPNRGVRPDGC